MIIVIIGQILDNVDLPDGVLRPRFGTEKCSQVQNIDFLKSPLF